MAFADLFLQCLGCLGHQADFVAHLDMRDGHLHVFVSHGLESGVDFGERARDAPDAIKRCADADDENDAADEQGAPHRRVDLILQVIHVDAAAEHDLPRVEGGRIAALQEKVAVGMAGLVPVVDGAAAALDALLDHFLAEMRTVLVDLRGHVLADIDRARMNALDDVVVEAEDVA